MSIYISVIKQYYDEGLWTENQIRALVEKQRISTYDFKVITGKDY